MQFCQAGSTQTFTIFIDQAYTGSAPDGTYITPYTSLSQALASVDLSSGKEKIFHVFSGTYNESFTISNGNNILIEGGSSSFTIRPPTLSAIRIENSSGVTFDNFTIDGSLSTTELLVVNSSEGVVFNQVTVNSAAEILNASSSSISISGSSLITSGVANAANTITNATGLSISSTSFQGGTYSLDISNSDNIQLNSLTFSGMLRGGITVDGSDNPRIDGITIASLPHSAVSAAGIEIKNGQGGRLDNVSISGSTPGGVCAAGELENGILVSGHNSLFLDNIAISAVGCNGFEVSSGDNITISNFSISGCARGVQFSSSEANLFKGTLSANTDTAANMSDSFAAIDFTTMTATTSGPGMRVTNTTTGDDTGYFVGNGSVFSNNLQQGILISGNGTSPGFRVAISSSSFSGNGNPAFYGIEADVPPVSADFTCINNDFTGQTLTIHPNLSPGASSCNP